MNYVRCIKAAVVFVVFVALAGCNSKPDKSGASSGTPQEKSATPAAPTLDKAVPAVPPQDKKDAQNAAARVLALLESGNFPDLYKEAAPGFKQIGSEEQFVAKFQQTRQKVGVLKRPQEISFGVLPGKGYVLVYRLENERYKSDFRLSFARSQSGKMELAGLNQHDELKK